MSDDHEQIVVRRRKLAALREGQQTAFPNDFRPDHSAVEVRERFAALGDEELAGAPEVAVAGRAMAIRHFGKAGFVTLQDRSGTLQAYLRRDALGDAAFAQYRGLD